MQRVIPPTNPIVRNAFPLLVFFLIAVFTGLWDKIYFLARLHILMLCGGLALILVGLSGRLAVVLRDPIAKSLVAFTAWFIICIPFAVWRGGSFAVLKDIWSRSALAFVLVAGCILTINQSKTIFKTIGYSVGLLAIVTLALRGHDNTGRIGLVGTRYENANDFGWTLILGLSFLSFLFLRGNRLQRFITLFFSAVIIFALVKTGSRASMIGFAVLAVILFLQAPRALRIRLGFGIPIVVALLMAVTPAQMRSRYTTLFGSDSTPQNFYMSAEERLQATAVGSAEARWVLLKDAVQLTLTYPLFGVGPGNFQVADNELSVERGEPYGGWHVTHNTYAQISSEMGIPGLIIYIVFLYQCIKPLNSIVRSRYPGKDWQDLRALAKSLRTTFGILISVAFFGSWAYDTNVPIIAGLACALSLIAQRQRALLTATQPVASSPAAQPERALEPAWMSRA